MRTEIFVDPSRPTPANGSYAGDTKRTIATTIWYPAAGRPSADDAVNAKPARHAGRFPLILFSHGINSNGEAYRSLLHAWAAHGYVVAAPTYPLSSSNAPGGAVVSDLGQQPADARFVIDRVLALDQAPRGLGSIVAPKRIGAAGHSLGALTTFGLVYNSCCLDARVRAAVTFAGIAAGYPGTYFTGIRTPLLLVHGDADRTVPAWESADAFARAQPPKFLLKLPGAGHSAPYQDPTDPTARLVTAATIDFFDYYLKSRSNGLERLRRDANVDGLGELEYVSD